MTPEEAREELRRRDRRAEFTPEKLLHPKQCRFVRALIDRVRRNVSSLAGRQSGKSFGGVMAALLIADKVPRVNLIYVTSTYATCEKMAFLPAVRMCEDYCLDAKPRYGNAPAIIFANGAVIYFIGADSEKAIGRLRGTPNLIACFIDECGVYADEMFTAMTEAVRPGLRPLAGTLGVFGTPPRGRVTGPWLDTTVSEEYDRHPFDYRDNDRIVSPETGRTLSLAEIESMIDEDLRAQGETREGAFFRCEYLAIPTVEASERVYNFSHGLNTFSDEPDALTNYLIFGIMGVKDRTDAIGLLAWEEDDDTVYLLNERAGAAVPEALTTWFEYYDPAIYLYPGEGKEAIGVLRARFPDLPIEPAAYPPEAQQIAELNDFLTSGRLRVLGESTFAHEVPLPTWRGGVNGKLDESGMKRQTIVPAARLGVIAARPFLPPRRTKEAPRVRLARLAAKKRADRMATLLQRKKARTPDNQFDDSEEPTFDDDRDELN